jgi:hypothetical protein
METKEPLSGCYKALIVALVLVIVAFGLLVGFCSF